MARAGHPHRGQVRLDLQVDQRRHPVPLEVDQAIEALEHGGRAVPVERICPQRGAQRAHHRGRRQTLPHHVAHRQADPLALQRNRVVPVAAHLSARQVASGQLDARYPRQALRQQAALERLRDGLGLPACRSLGHVDHLDDEARRPSVLAAGCGHAQEHFDLLPVAPHQPALLVEPAQLHCQHPLEQVSDRRVLQLGKEPAQRSVDQLGLRVADDLAEGLVRLGEAPFGAEQANPDRRRREGGAEALLALTQGDARAVEIDEDRHLRAQDLGVERLDDVVHRAHGIAAEHVVGLLVDGREEDDRHMAGALPPLDELRRLEAVETRHLHVQEDQVELVLQQALERLLARAGLDDAVTQRLQDGRQREEVLPLVVDDQDVGLGLLSPSLQTSSQARITDRRRPVSTGFVM